MPALGLHEVGMGAVGGGAGSCPQPGQLLPARTGNMREGAGCDPCSEIPPPGGGGGGGGGIQDPPGDQGQTTDALTSEKSGPMVLSGNSTSGPSPLTLNYTVDLSGVPADARIISAVAQYSCTGSSPSVTDDGGSASGTPLDITWSAEAVASLNAALRSSAFKVHAEARFSYPPPTASFSCSAFAVRWIEPGYP